MKKPSAFGMRSTSAEPAAALITSMLAQSITNKRNYTRRSTKKWTRFNRRTATAAAKRMPKEESYDSQSSDSSSLERTQEILNFEKRADTSLSYSPM